jgi:UDP-N-acetylglucosamine:LPS N-acetylglucosamine transferase
MPGLGRVTPAVGLVNTLTRRGEIEVVFASYAAGVRYLQRLGMTVEDLDMPAGLFIDSVAPQALQVLGLVERYQPDAVLVDGEPFLPVTLADVGVPVVYLANPYDLLPDTTTFQRVNRRLLTFADAVIVSSVGCPRPRPHQRVIVGTPCLEVPAIVKEFPLPHQRSPRPRVLVTSGGGSVGADPAFRAATDDAIEQTLQELRPLVGAGQISAVTLVLGVDAASPALCGEPWLRVIAEATELTDLYAHHEVLVARAGRNVAAEALYCGIPTVLLPIDSDRHRAAEQSANAAIAAKAPHIQSLPDWRRPGSISAAVRTALSSATRHARRRGECGNQAAIGFLDQIIAAAHQRNIALLLAAPIPKRAQAHG